VWGAREGWWQTHSSISTRTNLHLAPQAKHSTTLTPGDEVLGHARHVTQQGVSARRAVLDGPRPPAVQLVQLACSQCVQLVCGCVRVLVRACVGGTTEQPTNTQLQPRPPPAHSRPAALTHPCAPQRR
jgi:hypothetical protein